MKGLREADVYIVLCSQLSVDRRWINIELGAGLSRGKRIIPICHTDLKTTQLQRPIADYQSVNASDVEGLERLYQILAEEIGSSVPSANFNDLAAKVKEFEQRHRQDKAAMMESVDAASTTSSTDLTLPHPRVLCVSSKQFEATVGKDLELIRRSFPDIVQHELCVSSCEVRRLLVDNTFDIVHVAAYICPVYGDIVFSEVDPKTKSDVSGNPDLLNPKQFADLVKTTKAKLVVLANNETTALVARPVARNERGIRAGANGPEGASRLDPGILSASGERWHALRFMPQGICAIPDADAALPAVAGRAQTCHCRIGSTQQTNASAADYGSNAAHRSEHRHLYWIYPRCKKSGPIVTSFGTLGRFC